MKTLQDILNQRDLSVLFQPIMDFSSGTFLGFEALIRGPADNPLHSPINLFGAARQQGLSLEIEMLCRQIVLESFAAQNLPGKLFLNVSPEALTHPSFKNGQTLAYLENLGIDRNGSSSKLPRISPPSILRVCAMRYCTTAAWDSRLR
jgi:FOG: EAL domain